ncbi:MAG: ABC transporter permease [Clostridiaceae bacterium]|nr:ABC transporter permease [Clostridiaceae bacterium]
MRSLGQLSRRYLRRQWKRTLFTSLGIIMATALFAGVALLFSSLQTAMITTEAMDSGGWYYQVSGLTLEQASMLQANIRVGESEKIASSKWFARIEPTKQEQENGQKVQKWLMLRDASDLKNLSPYRINLLKGRLPERSDEIVFDTASLSQFPGAELGGTITLNLNTYQAGDQESLPDEARTYKIVGLLSWFNTGLPVNTYQALTLVPPAEQALAEVYLTVKPGADYENALFAALTDIFPDSSALVRRETVKYNEPEIGRLHVRTHDDLLRYMGQSSFDETNKDLMIFLGLLMSIIMVSVIFVIRNSLSMSVNERIGEFGLLRVVGGSPSQIRHLVLQDAFQLALISIPLGLLAGVVAMDITLNVVSSVDLDVIKNLKLVVSPWPLVLATALSLISILLAALGPAIRAGRLSPIEAVRHSDAYHINPGRVKSLRRKGRLSRIFFGPSGILASRNVRRDRRRFRNTVLSVGVSVLLFLAAGGISMQLQHEILRYDSEKTDFSLYAESSGWDWNDSIRETLDLLAGNHAISRTASYGSLSIPLKLEGSSFSDELVTAYGKGMNMNGMNQSETEIRADLSDPETSLFRNGDLLLADQDLLKELGLADPAKAWAAMENGQALLCQTGSVNLGGLGGATVRITRYGAGDAFPLQDIVDEKADGTNEIAIALPDSVVIAGTVDELPWFMAGTFSAMPRVSLIMSRDYVRNHFQIAADNPFTHSDRIAIDAVDGQEDALQRNLNKIIAGQDAGASAEESGQNLQLTDHYANLVKSRNLVFVVNIFLYGFSVVIILICAMNILNTVTTNIMLRRRELAVLQAVGMNRGQVCRMLFIECGLYGLTGAFWGSLAGLGLLALLSRSAGNLLMGSDYGQIPWNLVGITLAGAVLLAILAGLLPIRRVLNDRIVEAIRAEE